MTNLNSKILIYLFTGLFLLNLGFADPFKDLNIDFLLNDSTKTLLKKPLKSKKKDDKKPFKEIVKDYQKIEGLFTLYWNKEKNKAYISILPD